MGAFTVPILYTEARKSMETALRSTRVFINYVFADFARLSGRQYNPVEHYRTEDADTLLLTMGSFSEIAMDAVDQLRDRGEKVGLIRLRLWRPFPFDELRQAVPRTARLWWFSTAAFLPPDRPGPSARRSRQRCTPRRRGPTSPASSAASADATSRRPSSCRWWRGAG